MQPPLSCSCCGRLAQRLVRGWSGACYQRWLRAGKPASGPPAPKWDRGGVPRYAIDAAHAAQSAARRARMVEFRELESGNQGSPYLNLYGSMPPLSDRQIAEKMGVTMRTVCRYRARDRAAGLGWYKPGGRKPRSA